MMYDKSYCNTECEQRDCERNLKFHKPQYRFYSVANLDEDNPDLSHKTCKWKIKVTRKEN